MMQSMMTWMPLIILFTSLGFPAGTVIYWAMSNLFSAVQQYFITGFGSLPLVPGFGWLPLKEQKPLAPPPPPLVEGQPRKKGLMAKMMDQALAAQEAQKAGQTGAATATNGSSEPETPRVKRKGSEPSVKTVPTSTMKYSSDLKYRKENNGTSEGNGKYGSSTLSAGEGELTITPSTLPRKKKGRR
jgi:YidC/Oxa1 family membrane protein insertase